MSIERLQPRSYFPGRGGAGRGGGALGTAVSGVCIGPPGLGLGLGFAISYFSSSIEAVGSADALLGIGAILGFAGAGLGGAVPIMLLIEILPLPTPFFPSAISLAPNVLVGKPH